MQSSDLIAPLAIGTPIALSGDKNIPSQTASGTDTSSIAKGFLPITSEPLDDGGVAPERIDFNGMFYLSTDQRVFLQNGGIITYDSNVATAIGGYPAGAILGYIDTSGNYGFVKSLVDNNQYNFITTPSYINGEYWELANILNVVPLQNDINEINSRTFTYSQKGIGNGTTDLSTYLPDDNKNYLVLVEAACEGYGSTAKIKTDLCPSDVYVCRGDYDSGRATQAAGACMFPVGSGRTITASGVQWATLKGYMRF